MARKYTYEEKLNIVEGYLNGDFTLSEKAHELGYHAIPGCFQRWIKQYKVHGREGLHRKNRTYTSELKMKAVEEYLSGKDSAVNIVAKYDISCVDVLLRWVSLYNSNRKLKDYIPIREVYMSTAKRKTTLEERKEIAQYCIAHDKNYKETAALYKVSYRQVYSWVKKYETEGESALSDRRGYHKSDE